MNSDRAGATINQTGDEETPAIIFSTDFAPKREPPAPFTLDDCRRAAKDHGFVDSDTDFCGDFFSRISYQHASEYFGVVPDDLRSIQALNSIIMIDRKYQSLILEYIGLFELQFRAQYSYLMTKKYGPFAHRNANLFSDEGRYLKTLENYQEEFNRQYRAGNPLVINAYERYGDMPMWEAVEVMTLGTLSKLFTNTKDLDVRKGVAGFFGVMYRQMRSWMITVTDVRNRCAHFNRMLGRRLVKRPSRISGVALDNGSCFYVVLILLKLLSSDMVFGDIYMTNQGVQFLADIVSLFERNERLFLACGIPDDWRDLVSSRDVIGFGGQILKEPPTVE